MAPTLLARVAIAIVFLNGSISRAAAPAHDTRPADASASVGLAGNTQQRIAATGRRGFLYLVKRGTQSFYLYGGAAASSDDVFPFNSLLVQALQNSRLMLIDHDPLWSVREAITLGTLPPDQNLEALLSPIMLGATRRALTQMGIDSAPTEHFKPWLVAELLTQEYGERTGLRADRNTVSLLMMYARNARLNLQSLDSNQSEVEILNSMPMEVQIARLAQVISDLTTDRGELKIRGYVRAWAAGDESALQAVQELYRQPTYGAYTTWYWNEYHQRHMRQLSDSVLRNVPESLTAFVAVPALDLPGSSGLLQIFASKGCTVKNLQP